MQHFFRQSGLSCFLRRTSSCADPKFTENSALTATIGTLWTIFRKLGQPPNATISAVSELACPLYVRQRKKPTITTKCRGVGIRRVLYQRRGNWSALFAMMFKDSHNEWQPAMGYGWEKG